MSEERVLNPQIVHDATAFLFWTLAEKVGVSDATDAVIESAGRCLAEQDFTPVILEQYAVGSLSSGEQAAILDAIAVEAEKFAVDGNDLLGVIYMEDVESGKTPSAESVDTSALKAIPKAISVSGPSFEKIGSLCLRHPLPAIVFAKSLPRGEAIEVADTSAALGFHLPMYLTNISAQQLGDELFFLSGLFQIPVPSSDHGTHWNRALQNSVRFVSGMGFYGEAGKSEIEVEW